MRKEIRMVSVLRCEPNTDFTSDHEVNARSGTARFLWRIWLDDRLIATKAMPIDPLDDWAELEAESENLYFGDGRQRVAIRRLGGCVLWFRPPPKGFPGPFSPAFALGEVYVFDYAQYTQALSACLNASLFQAKLQTGVSNHELNGLAPDELALILSWLFPEEHSPIYTTPALPSDPTGARLVERVRSLMVNAPLDPIEICNEPPGALDLRIGLDIADYPECHWQVGLCGDHLAVQFVSRPCFPLWLTGPQVDEALGAEVRAVLTGIK